ncbi:MAG: peptidylprolyl isomerase [Bacteroidia bacterium]|nr:peptidylprolyl isomerase [Bacteroidia bacterium]
MKTLRLLSLICFVLSTTKLDAQNPFTGKPMYNVYTTRGGQALGSFTIELFPNIAPLHCKNFDSLVTAHFYDSTAFHRCIPGFVIQGGGFYSKNGPMNMWGQNDPSQTNVPAEFSVAQHKRGAINAARLANNINSATSQWCVMTANNFFLDGNYTVYGRVLKGMNWVDTIVNTPKLQPPPSTYSSMPLQKIEMFITAIGSNDSIPQKLQLVAPANHTVGIDSNINLQLKWNAVSDGIIYQVLVSRDSTFNSDTLQLSQSANAYFYCAQRKGNTRYFWRARVNNGGHYSPWSDTWDFHTKGETTGLNQQSSGHTAITVFPNPSNAYFKIENLTEGSRIELYSLKGELLLSQKVSSKEHLLNLSDKSKGVYLLRINLPEGTDKEFQLVKE